MKTIDLHTKTAAETADPRDARYPASKTFKRCVVPMADGYHAFYQLPDGKTTGHMVITTAQMVEIFETIDPNFIPPKPIDKSTPKG